MRLERTALIAARKVFASDRLSASLMAPRVCEVGDAGGGVEEEVYSSMIAARAGRRRVHLRGGQASALNVGYPHRTSARRSLSSRGRSSPQQ